MAKQISTKEDKWSTLGLKLRPEDKEIADEFLSNWGALRGISKGDAFMHLIRNAQRNDDASDSMLFRIHELSDSMLSVEKSVSEIKTVLKLIAFRGDPDAVLKYLDEANASLAVLKTVSNHEPDTKSAEYDLIAMFSQIKTSNDDETSAQTGLHNRGIATVAGTKRVERNFMKKKHSAG